MIEIKNVTKRFGEKTAVNNLSVDIPTGCIVGFIGPNGAGKTTTIHMMTGVLTPDEGTITLNGKDIVKDPVNAKREFGLVPDSPDLFLRLSGIDVYKRQAYHRLMIYTGGRCAEELIFNSITTGASNDIEQATKLARAMITRYGMSDNFGMMALETVNNAYLGGDTSLQCSNETATKIDEEVATLIKKAHDEAYQILLDNKMKLHELAKYLYEKETITGEQFMYILNKPVEIPTSLNNTETNV